MPRHNYGYQDDSRLCWYFTLSVPAHLVQVPLRSVTRTIEKYNGGADELGITQILKKKNGSVLERL